VTADLAAELAAKLATPGFPLREFRVPLWQRLFSLFGTIFLALVACLMAFFTAWALTMWWAIGLFMMLITAFIGALVGYTWRDYQGKRLSIILNGTSAKLDLPSGRSLIHRPPAQHLTVPYTDIAGIDARYEAYGSLGMEIMQRAYAMHLKGGGLVFLFEDRALGTGMESSTFTDIAEELARRSGVTIHDLGTVEGNGGALAAWGAHAPGWTAPPLPRDRAMRLWARAGSTGALALGLVLILVVMRLIG
jgi:hypothetical protein